MHNSGKEKQQQIRKKEKKRRGETIVGREKNHKYKVLFSFFVFSSTFSFQIFPDFAKLQKAKSCWILSFGQNLFFFFPAIEKFQKQHGSKIKKRKYLFIYHLFCHTLRESLQGRLKLSSTQCRRLPGRWNITEGCWGTSPDHRHGSARSCETY